MVERMGIIPFSVMAVIVDGRHYDFKPLHVNAKSGAFKISTSLERTLAIPDLGKSSCMRYATVHTYSNTIETRAPLYSTLQLSLRLHLSCDIYCMLYRRGRLLPQLIR